MENKHKHIDKEIAILEYLEWYVKFLLDNGYHPSRSQRMAYAGKDSGTLAAWENELQGRQFVELVNRGRLGNVMIIRNVYFIDGR